MRTGVWVVPGKEGNCSSIRFSANKSRMPVGHLDADTQQAVRCFTLALTDLSVSEDTGEDGMP